MTFLIWLLIIVVAIVVVLLIRKYTSLEFVAHAKLLFRTWSVWLASAGAAIGALAQSFPDAALHAWAILPPDIKSVLPPNIVSFISPTLVVLAVLAQYVRQPRLLERKQQMDGQP
jgi:Ca2+/Na+ antiporter